MKFAIFVVLVSSVVSAQTFQASCGDGFSIPVAEQRLWQRSP